MRLLKIKASRIEVEWRPSSQVHMAGVSRIGQSHQQGRIAPRSAAILRTAGTPSGQTHRILDAGLDRNGLLYRHVVLPPVPEIVLPSILEPTAGKT